MLRYLQIENFKSLRQVMLPVERLNLFFGMNGAGKSSVLQSLLLLRQSYWMNNRAGLDTLHLNGNLARLGTQRDVFCQMADSDVLRFYAVFSGNKTFDLQYRYTGSRQGVAADRMERILDDGSEEVAEDKGTKGDDGAIRPDTVKSDFKESLFGMHGFQYLSAEHLGPRNLYSSENFDLDGINPFGGRGEYIIPFLAKEGTSVQVSHMMCHKGTRTTQLIDQVSAWLGDISPRVQVVVQDIPENQRARLSYRYRGEQLISDDISPINTGFGVSYVLPLVTELLLSDENSLILLENPESHLHPKGQAAIGELMSLAAQNGAQIFCESHSDHIINGVRVAVKNQKLDPENLYIAYFQNNRNQESQVTNIHTDRNGDLSRYPEGLLDEWGILMSELI